MHVDTELEPHPYALLFPRIEGAAREELKADIEANGVIEPIVLHPDGRILDGTNRYAIVREVGAAFATRTYTGDDPLQFVLSANLHRRHLEPGQRAMIADSLANMPQGRPGKAATLQVKRADAAALLNVSERSVASAAVVREHGAAELRAAVERGHIPVSTAAAIASEPAERQHAIVAALPRDTDGRLTREARTALAPIIKEVRAEKQIEKKRRRDDREAELGRKQLAMPEKMFGVAIEDFEWDHEPWSRDTGMDRHPANHYVTAADAHTPEEIVARTADRFKCLAPDAVLYMWTTIPHAAIAHKVLELRGFKYVTQRVWGKLRPGKGRGPGYWLTGEHEILLIGVRGKVVPPATAHFPSFFTAPVGEHSAKPAEQYEHAEVHFPSLPRIELNARTARPGWHRWGNEAPPDDSAE